MLTYAGYQRVRGSDAELAQLGGGCRAPGARVQELNTSFGLVVVV